MHDHPQVVGCNGVLLTFCLGSPWIAILWISASWVGGITDVSHHTRLNSFWWLYLNRVLYHNFRFRGKRIDEILLFYISVCKVLEQGRYCAERCETIVSFSFLFLLWTRVPSCVEQPWLKSEQGCVRSRIDHFQMPAPASPCVHTQRFPRPFMTLKHPRTLHGTTRCASICTEDKIDISVRLWVLQVLPTKLPDAPRVC
jgi:hypothetical protein